MPASRSASRPSSLARSTTTNNAGEPLIHKLDYTPGGRPLVPHNGPHSPRQSSEHSLAGSFFSDIASAVASQQRRQLSTQLLRYLSFIWAILNCLGAGSLTAYSLYAPLFQTRLHYTQLQVNGVSIAAELAMYTPVPLFGLLCDRAGPGIASLLGGVMFGVGYVVAAFTYASGPPGEGGGWPYWVMVAAFVPIGCATSCMYMSAVTLCAKNFGRGRYKGLALALPIACFGLSGMWESQVGSNLLFERRADGGKGEVDVYRYFLFLGCFLLGTGVVGFFTLRVVGEGELIDEAVEELEASGLLEDSEFFQPNSNQTTTGGGYGTIATGGGDHQPPAEVTEDLQKSQQLERERKKTWLLNEETRRFLTDPTLWWLAAGFFLVTGPGEAFINNLGTIVGTLEMPASATTTFASSTLASAEKGKGKNGAKATTNVATLVSIFAITSTLARILAGTVTDLLAPTPQQRHRHSAPDDSEPPPLPSTRRLPQISRITFLLASALLTSLACALLASGLLQNRRNLFPLITGCMGFGYGAVFSLTPIIVSVVWGVENFGTNWGLLNFVPALGATGWGVVYSGVYQGAAGRGDGDGGGGEGTGGLCYGWACYGPTFWGMAGSVWVACGLWVWAWRGRGGWRGRGVAV